MDIRKVKKLIELLEESGIDELEIKEGEESVRISRHSKTRLSSTTLRRRCRLRPLHLPPLLLQWLLPLRPPLLLLH